LNTTELTYLLRDHKKITKKNLSDLEKLVETFPYFQAARALYLKGLKSEGSYAYNLELKKTAAYTTDRSILFEYITSEGFLETPQISNTEKAPWEEIQKAEAILNPYLFERKPITEEAVIELPAEEILELHKPLPFNKNDTHSFEEWLKLTSVKPILREESEEKETLREEKFKLIDKFIEENPRIDPKTPTSADNLAKSFTQATDTLMTETLAKVYVQQKNYKKAIQAYKILILKNPEKSGFFADQIRAINKLQEK